MLTDEENATKAVAFQSEFDQASLGHPLLVCRWRLAAGRLPLANRHLRGLRNRELDGKPIPRPLVAWAKEHIDWTLQRGSQSYPDGVLMLVVDEGMRAAMAVGPYQELESTTLRSLARRARSARREAERTCLAPETLWVIRPDCLEWLDDRMNIASGAASLVRDMARTLGITVVRRDAELRPDQLRREEYDNAFFVSDEHGVIIPSDRPSDAAERYVEGYRKLLASVSRRQERRDKANKERG